MTERGDVRIDAGNGGGRRSRSRGLAPLFGALLAAMALGPRETTAQMAEEAIEERGFELLGHVGLITPVGNLTDNPDAFGASMKVSLVYGVDAIYWTSKNFGVGFVGLYAPGELQTLATSFQGVVPDDLGDVDYLAGAVNAIYRFRGSGSSSLVEPYFAVGGGLRRISVDAIAGPEVESSTDPTATLAGGIRIEGIGPGLMMRVEIRDFISSYESPATGDSKLQNDFAISFGIGTRFR